MINKVITSSVKRICVMDKYADTTAVREPLFTDVASAVIGKRDVEMIGSSYGISSKDFAPLHVEAIIKNHVKPHTADQFTIASPETAFPIGITRNTSSGTLVPMLQSAETSRQSSLSSLKQSFMRPSLPKIRTQDSQEKPQAQQARNKESGSMHCCTKLWLPLQQEDSPWLTIPATTPRIQRCMPSML